MEMTELIEIHYDSIKGQDFKGYDIYDGLKSSIFRKSPFFRSRLLRLAWIQFFKRFPVNLRSLVLIPRGQNPKGLALIIRGLANLYKISGEDRYLHNAYRLADAVISQRARGRDYFCVGYDFFWQAKAFTVPEFTPNMIVSAFTGQAFLDLYEIDGDEKWLEYVRGIGEFLSGELRIFESENEMVFGYVPGEDTIVHNANLMGSSLFARLFYHTAEKRYREYSVKSAQYSVSAQRKDGAWVYGDNRYHKWVDNFHTGFNLVALYYVRNYLSIDRWKDNISAGLNYHLNNHFLEDMTPKYYDSGLYPVDIHNCAQGINTLLTYQHYETAERLLNRSVDLFWDKGKKYFYYRITRLYKNKINYFRWSQAWMFYALSKYLSYKNKNQKD